MNRCLGVTQKGSTLEMKKAVVTALTVNRMRSGLDWYIGAYQYDGIWGMSPSSTFQLIPEMWLNQTHVRSSTLRYVGIRLDLSFDIMDSFIYMLR
jgi:hypothetical protein